MIFTRYDLNGTTGKVNNIFSCSTPNYVLKDHAPTPSVNWIQQLKETFFDFSVNIRVKRVMFYKHKIVSKVMR